MKKTMRGVIGPTAGFLAAAAGLVLTSPAWAGGSPENVLIIADPTNAQSLYVANYYRAARNIPDGNVLYMAPGAANYQQFASVRQEGFQGTLAQRRIASNIDYVVVMPGSPFFVSAPGLVTDACFPVTRFSISSAYTMSFLRERVLQGGLPSETGNQYFTPNDFPVGFDSDTGYLNGSASGDAAARRYYIGAMLGYTGPGGNTIEQVIAMIDRSVAADGTRPSGTFYFMNTNDQARNVRAGGYQSAVDAIIARGGTAVIQNGVLPNNTSNALGIMTGWPNPDIAGSGVTLRPGSFAEHLTSFAATFDTPSQTKISAWISAGASGSAGAVEEPCNYTGKFVAANFHALYLRGLSLGEAYLRSSALVPFQSLLLGDPMSRPFAQLPTVTVPDAPAGVVSGVVTLTPQATATAPGNVIIRHELFVNGVFAAQTTASGSFQLDTRQLPEGVNEIRVLSYDSTLQRFVGRWVGQLNVNNLGVSTTLTTSTPTGDLSSVLSFTLGTSAGRAFETRLLHNGRVVGVTRSPSSTISVAAQMLGAGPSRLVAETRLANGRLVRSAPVSVNVANAPGTPTSVTPVAYAYIRAVRPGSAVVVELPASVTGPLGEAVYTVVTPPAGFTLLSSGPGPYRIYRAPSGHFAPTRMTFQVSAGASVSNTATITLYNGDRGFCTADLDGSGTTSVDDFFAFLTLFADGAIEADFTRDGAVDINDFFVFLSDYAAGCF